MNDIEYGENTIMSSTLSEFHARTVSTYINGEYLTYADICYRIYELVEDNYGKCKDGHFGFSMKEYKRLTENDMIIIMWLSIFIINI